MKPQRTWIVPIAMLVGLSVLSGCRPSDEQGPPPSSDRGAGPQPDVKEPAPVADSEKPEKKTLDVSFIPENCFFVQITHPKRLADSPPGKGLSNDVIEGILAPMAEDSGWDPRPGGTAVEFARKLEEIVELGLTRKPAVEGFGPPPIDRAWIVRFAEPIDDKDLNRMFPYLRRADKSAAQKGEERPTEREPEPIVALPGNMEAIDEIEELEEFEVEEIEPLLVEEGPREKAPEPDESERVVVHRPNDRTVVVASQRVFEKMQAAEQVQSKLVQRLRQVDADRDLIVVATTEGAGEWFEKWAARLDAELPPEMKGLPAVPDLAHTATLWVDLREDPVAELVVEARDAASAVRLKELLEKHLAACKGLNSDVRDEIRRLGPRGPGPGFVNLIDEALAGATVGASGAKVTVRVKRPETLAGLPLAVPVMRDFRARLHFMPWIVPDLRVRPPGSELAKPPVAPLEDAVTIQLTSWGTVLFAGGECGIEALKPLLRRRRQVLDTTPGGGVSSATVIIRADRRASAGHVQQVIGLCQEARFERFALCAELSPTGPSETFQGKVPAWAKAPVRPQIPAGPEASGAPVANMPEGHFNIKLPLARPAHDPNRLPPLRVRLEVDLDGKLKSIRLGDRAVRDFAGLRQEVIAILGDRRGPGSVAETIEAELDCDDQLWFCYVIDAITAVSGYVERREGLGHRIMLIERIKFAAPESKFDELEEMPEEEVDDLEAAPVEVDLSELGLEHAPRNDLLEEIRTQTGPRRGELARRAGVGLQSESAVASALKWLAAHQLPDGGWSFDHNLCPGCGGKCRNAGELAEARNAATGLALLAFLGAGQTHKEGKYKSQVKAGLYYLVSHAKIDKNGASLYEKGGRMYSHGICSIALCEAYAMTHDKGLYAPTQKAIDFIGYAQDPVGGGWRYEPRQPGDTSVTCWQLGALKSGHMAYLRVPSTAAKKAAAFLDSVQADDGASYGYTEPGDARGTSAMGLLARMYLGWKKDNPALEQGVKRIAEGGPSQGDMYYNYNATRLLRNWEGDEWKKWNARMREHLVDSQATEGHEAGSWHFPKGDQGAARGGRLYCTAMATMILEVYYRHLPIYRTQAVEEDLPED